METQDFSGSLLQVTNQALTAFSNSNELLTEIQYIVTRIPSDVRNMVEYVEDTLLCVQYAESIVTNVNTCEFNARQVSEQFDTVIQLVGQISAQCICSRKLSMDEGIQRALTLGIQRLTDVQMRWSELAKFFSKLVVLLKTDMKGESARQRNFSINIVTSAQRSNFALSSTQTCAMAISVNAIVEAYLQVSDEILEEYLIELTHLISIPETGAEQFLDLEKKCHEAAPQIQEIINASKEELCQQLEEGIEYLKQV